MVSSSFMLLMPSPLSGISFHSYLIPLYVGIEDVSEMRPAPSGVFESPIPKLEKVNKRKMELEGPQYKKAPARRRSRNIIPVDIESVHQLNDEEEKDEGEDSALVARARKLVEAAKPSRP